ncbi:MAG TPA: carboxylesterase family protein [Chitinophagaceae bacterium]|nr:carboxylesterase family protein [Chitinophagaceae bacterium]
MVPIPRLLLFLSVIFIVSLAPKPTALEVVKTTAGFVLGVKNAEGTIHIFKGIPFAAPPVGNLRWQAPQPATSWTGIKKCESFSASPMQNEPASFSMWTEEYLIPKKRISEDCLYLNVWSGANASGEKRPVLVYIYGGGFGSGGSAVPIYDGEAMAKKGLVFVSFNYRVGVFGFFAHPELTKESGHAASGNYGLLDQIAALKWIQENIAAFGGDPANVTIAGQSAGAMSVNCLVASPLAKGLFTKAIAESGASFISNPMSGTKTLAAAEQQGVKTAQALKVTSLAELRNKPANALLQAQGTGPIIDGYVLPDAIAALFKAGNENKVALLTGWNEDEGLLFGPAKNAADFTKQLTQQYGDAAKRLLQFYPAGSDAEAAASQLKLSRDLIFGVQNYTWATVQSKKGNAPVYVYRFTRKVPATGEYIKYGAFHTGEVPYAYNNLRFVNRLWEPVDQMLADAMSGYWANFAKTGNPNGGGLPEWPAFTVTDKKIMLLSETPGAKPMADAGALDFLSITM